MISRINHSGRDAGFTLIEMLVVLAILGAALGLFLARGPLKSPGLVARDVATQLAEAFRLARTRAIATGTSATVTVGLPRGPLVTEGGEAAALPGAVVLMADIPDGATGSGTAKFTFEPDGSASAGTVLVGVQAEALALASLTGGRPALAVSVDWLTGKVRVDAR